MANTTLSQAEQMALSQGQNFVWHELYIPDVAAAEKFYTEVLGFGTQVMDMQGPGGPYHMLTRNGQAVAGVISTKALPDPNVPPHWAVYLSVDDVDGKLDAVKQHGGKIVVPPFDVPTIGRMSLIQDPQGAHIWLFKPAM